MLQGSPLHQGSEQGQQEGAGDALHFQLQPLTPGHPWPGASRRWVTHPPSPERCREEACSGATSWALVLRRNRTTPPSLCPCHEPLPGARRWEPSRHNWGAVPLQGGGHGGREGEACEPPSRRLQRCPLPGPGGGARWLGTGLESGSVGLTLRSDEGHQLVRHRGRPAHPPSSPAFPSVKQGWWCPALL